MAKATPKTNLVFGRDLIISSTGEQVKEGQSVDGVKGINESWIEDAKLCGHVVEAEEAVAA
jgi:hypothetical protein